MNPPHPPPKKKKAFMELKKKKKLQYLIKIMKLQIDYTEYKNSTQIHYFCENNT